MNEAMVLDLFRDAIYVTLMTSAPMLLVALIVGLIIAVFQATTQIQEQTLSFVPKLVAILLVVLLLGPWILNTMVDYTLNVFENLVLYIK